jgi:hypothetical protein
MKFSDIILSDAELDDVQAALEAADKAYEATHGFPMGKGERTLTRARLIREFKEGVWANRDYTPADEGMEMRGYEDYQ